MGVYGTAMIMKLTMVMMRRLVMAINDDEAADDGDDEAADDGGWCDYIALDRVVKNFLCWNRTILEFYILRSLYHAIIKIFTQVNQNSLLLNDI